MDDGFARSPIAFRSSPAGRTGRGTGRLLAVLAAALAAGAGACGGNEDAGRAPDATAPSADRLHDVYRRSVEALESGDSTAYFATLAPATRDRIDSVLDARQPGFDRYATLAGALVPSVPLEPARTGMAGDTAVLVLVSTRRDTVMSMGDSVAILDDYVQRVTFLPDGKGWGIVRMDGAHKPEWMALEAFLASRREAGPWSYPREEEHLYELPPLPAPGVEQRISAVGMALDDRNLYVRLSLTGPADTARLGGVRLYLDVDADPGTGGAERAGVRGRLGGWERELRVDWWRDRPEGPHSFRVAGHATVAAVTAGEEPGITPESDSNVPFWQGRGWLRAEGRDLLLRVPRSLVEGEPPGRFAFHLVDWPFAAEANGRRWTFPPEG